MEHASIVGEMDGSEGGRARAGFGAGRGSVQAGAGFGQDCGML